MRGFVASLPCGSKVHPRVCGAVVPVSRATTVLHGVSPRMRRRGLGPFGPRLGRALRFIPAYAGLLTSRATLIVVPQVHPPVGASFRKRVPVISGSFPPRLRGVADLVPFSRTLRLGSSPRARGRYPVRERVAASRGRVALCCRHGGSSSLVSPRFFLPSLFCSRVHRVPRRLLLHAEQRVAPPEQPAERGAVLSAGLA